MTLSTASKSGLAAGAVALAGATVLAAVSVGPANAATTSSAVGIVASGQSSFTANSASQVPASDFISGVSGIDTDTDGSTSAEASVGSATLFGVSPEATIRLAGVTASCDDGETTVRLGSGSRAGATSIAGTYRSARSITVSPTVRLTIAGGGDGSVTAVSARLLGGSSDVLQSFSIASVSCAEGAAATPSPTPSATDDPTDEPTASPTSTRSRSPRPSRTPTDAPSPTSVPTSLPVTG